jgi:deoxyribonuclease V
MNKECKKKGERFQETLSKHIRDVDCFENIETLAGVDVSYKEDTASAACVVMKKGSIIGKKISRGQPTFPYVSSFFALREFPLIYEVLRDIEFDLLFVHGHGKAHPRRFGLACHTGLYFGKPTVGVAGRKLVGEYDETFEKQTYVHHEDEIIGAVLQTHGKMNPVFVSVGHMISLQSAIEFTFENVRNHKFPEVLRLAHVISKEVKEEK